MDYLTSLIVGAIRARGDAIDLELRSGDPGGTEER
jgi:hypothetical protein